MISSRRRDQIPDPDADGTPGIASSPRRRIQLSQVLAPAPWRIKFPPPKTTTTTPTPPTALGGCGGGGVPRTAAGSDRPRRWRGESREGFSATGRRRRGDAGLRGKRREGGEDGEEGDKEG